MEGDNAEGSSISLIELSPEQEGVLVGTLLGDGCLAKHGNYHRLHIKHKAEHRSLIEFKHEVFRDFVTMPVHWFDQQLNGRGYPCGQFASRTHPIFTKWHSRFYEGRRKIVPDDIDLLLSPLSLAVWIMDDGAADFAGCTLQTHSFSREEVQLLVDVVNEKFDLATSSRRNKSGWVIYVPAASLPRLTQIVRPHLLEEFNYKLAPRRFRTP